jgi:hypothetical protein
MRERGEELELTGRRPQPQRHREPEVRVAGRARRDVRLELVGQRGQPVVGVAGRLLVQAVEHVPGPDVEVDDARRHPVGVQEQPRDVDRRRAQLVRGSLGKGPERGVGLDQVGAAVDDHGGVGGDARPARARARCGRAPARIVEPGLRV